MWEKKTQQKVARRCQVGQKGDLHVQGGEKKGGVPRAIVVGEEEEGEEEGKGKARSSQGSDWKER